MNRSKFLGTQRLFQPREDEVFQVALKAKKAIERVGIQHVINGTLGSLYDEDFHLVTFPSVYQTYRALSDDVLARYASDLMAPTDYAQAIKTWLFHDLSFPHRVIATPGGSGAIALAIKNVTSPNDTILVPTPGWSPYHTIALEAGCQSQRYTLFTDTGVDFSALEAAIIALQTTQRHVVVVLNDPAHNPTGYTLQEDDWKQLLAVLLRRLAQTPITLILDVAYLDYSASAATYPQRFHTLATLSPQLSSLIAFSGSKTLTAYGMRIGALVITGSTETDQTQLYQACAYSVRGLWSVANTGAMAMFAKLVNDPQKRQALRDDLALAQTLLKRRAESVLNDLKSTSLPIYPFHEGFFLTLRVEDVPSQTQLHQALMQEDIYTVATPGGLRIALCSIPLSQLKGFVSRVEKIYNSQGLTITKPVLY